jgi:hypothetical protein
VICKAPESGRRRFALRSSGTPGNGRCQWRDSLAQHAFSRRRTVFVLAEFAHDVQGLVLFESLAQEHHLLLRLDPLVLRIGTADQYHLVKLEILS